MPEPLTINQGRPRSKFFALAYAGKLPEPDQEIYCKHPKLPLETKAKYHGFFRYLWAEVPDSFCLLNYGVNSLKLKTALETNFPEFRNIEKITFLLLEEI